MVHMMKEHIEVEEIQIWCEQETDCSDIWTKKKLIWELSHSDWEKIDYKQ